MKKEKLLCPFLNDITWYCEECQDVHIQFGCEKKPCSTLWSRKDLCGECEMWKDGWTIFFYPLSKREWVDLDPTKFEFFYILELSKNSEEVDMYTIALDREAGRLWDVLTNKKILGPQLVKTDSIIILSENYHVKRKFIKKFTKLPYSTRS